MTRTYRKTRKLLLILLIALPELAGCEKDTSHREQSDSPNDSAWPKPFSPTAPSPLAGGPNAAPGLSPTQYADVQVGMKALYRVTPERGDPSRQTIRIIRTDANTAYAHQIAETKTYGRYVQHLSYNRFVEGSPQVDQFNPTHREHYIGDQMVSVGSMKLLCRVYEVHRGPYVYRTLMCDDVPGTLVQHSDNASGVWKTRLQLLDVWD